MKGLIAFHRVNKIRINFPKDLMVHFNQWYRPGDLKKEGDNSGIEGKGTQTIKKETQ